MESAITEHLEEGDLVRLLDGEGSEEERAAARAHLALCDECRQVADALAGASSWVHLNVTAVDGQAPDDLTRARALESVRAKLRSSARSLNDGGTEATPGAKNAANVRHGGARYRLVAAGIAVLLLASLTVGPVRAWILDGLRGFSDRSVVSMPADRPEPPPPVRSAASARFAVAGPVFRIELSSSQLEGELTLRTTTEAEAFAEIVGGSEETLVVLPSGLLIGNQAGSSASYVVALPVDVIREIEVRIGNAVIASHSVAAVPGETNVPLAPAVDGP